MRGRANFVFASVGAHKHSLPTYVYRLAIGAPRCMSTFVSELSRSSSTHLAGMLEGRRRFLSFSRTSACVA
jgi:hypothetical protein